MSRTVRLLLPWVAAFCCWHVLALWVVQGTVRFYLLVPPLFLVSFLALSKNPWQQLKEQSRGTLLFLGLLPTLCCGMLFLFAGPAWFFTSRNLLHVWEISYFFLAVIIVASLVLVGLRRLCQAAANYLPEKSTTRFLVLQGGPAFLFLLTLVPYLMALSYVFHLKLPITDNPHTGWKRSFEDVDFKTSDGLALRGWFVPAKKASTTTVVICHGIGINRALVLPWVKVADALEANVLLFDFRGHGESEGHAGSIGYHERHDVLAAIAYLRQERTDVAQKIIGVGVSMGCAALVGAAAEVEPAIDGLVLDSGFASAVDLTDNILAPFPEPVRTALTLPGIPLASLHAGCDLGELRPEKCIGAVRAPVLIVHDDNDALIPLDHARRLFANAAEPKKLLHHATPYGHVSLLYGHEAEYLRNVREMFGSK